MAQDSSRRNLRLAQAAVIATATLHAASLLYQFGISSLPPIAWMFLAYSITPYVVCLGLMALTRLATLWLGALAAMAAVDAVMYWTVFMAPFGSIEVATLLIAPLGKLLAALPVGALFGWAVATLVSHHRTAG